MITELPFEVQTDFETVDRLRQVASVGVCVIIG
jgi:hypothetical protein